MSNRLIFFCKQKRAYEIKECDWSSDVCSSDLPMIIGGEEVRNGSLAEMICPHDHRHVLGQFHQANALYVEKAIDVANEAKAEWSQIGRASCRERV